MHDDKVAETSGTGSSPDESTEADQGVVRPTSGRAELELTSSSLWRHRDFMLLWGGQSISEIGSAVTVVALPLIAVVTLHATTFEVGALTAAGTVCFLLVALPAGIIVDRVRKRRLMLGCDLARMAIIGSVPIAAALGVLTMIQLFAVALLAGLATVFFDVAYQSYVPALVGPERLHNGNGKLGATQAFAQVSGPGLGGILFGLLRAGVMTADALSFAISVASLALIRSRQPRPVQGRAATGDTASGGAATGDTASGGAATGDTASGGAAAGDTASGGAAIQAGVAPGAVDSPGTASEAAVADGGSASRTPRVRGARRAEFFAGLTFVLRHPVLRKIAAYTGTANLFGQIAFALDIIFLIRVVHVAPAETGVLVSVVGLGGIAAGVLSGTLARRIGAARIIWVSPLVFGAVPMVMPLTGPGPAIAFFPIAMFGLGFSATIYNIAQLSYRQLICPPDLLGRMNAAIRWIVWGTLPLGGLIGGTLGGLIGIRPALWVGVTGCWAASFWVVFSPLRRMRDIPVRAATGMAGATAGGPNPADLARA